MADDSKRRGAGEVLTGDDKWWEFFDAQTYEVKTDLPVSRKVTSDMLDWRAMSTTQRKAPLGFGFFNRCEACGQAAPPDLTFCVYCGGTPISPQSIQRFSIVIKEIRDASAREQLAEHIAASGQDLKLAEVDAMLEELPAVFNLDVRRDRAAAICARLADIGVGARAFPLEDVSTLMVKETAETILRDRKETVTFAAMMALTVVAAAIWAPLFIAGIGAVVWRFLGRRDWYNGHYALSDRRWLNQLAGFEPGVADQAADELRRTRDAEVRRAFSSCLIEYYMLSNLMGRVSDHYGGVLSPAEKALRELLEQIVDMVAQFGAIQRQLETYEPARLRSRMADVQQRLETVSDARAAGFLREELEHLHAQQTQVERLAALRLSFVERLESMAGSLEALRHRMAQANALREKFEVRMEDVLKELDDELEVFEQTFSELEPAVHIPEGR